MFLILGTLPAIIANVAENSVLFAAYGACQKLVGVVQNKHTVNELTALDNAFAGFLAAFFSSFTLCPTELIKCKLQAMRETQSHNLKPDEKLPKVSPYSLTKHILKTEGVPGKRKRLD